jgi:CcmD family protein
MHKIKRLIGILLPAILSTVVRAQTTGQENADVMRSNGKIYVVIAVVLTILVGLFFYVFSLDRKISRLEKKP